MGYLHGTNATVGGFQVEGGAWVAKSNGSQSVHFNVDFIWNDIIDPNPDYGTDVLKAAFAEIITLGGATAYTIRISWPSEFDVEVGSDGKAIGVTGGWPGAAP